MPDSYDLGWLSGTPATLRNAGFVLNDHDGQQYPSALPWEYSHSAFRSDPSPLYNDWDTDTFEPEESDNWNEEESEEEDLEGETLDEDEMEEGREPEVEPGFYAHSRQGGNSRAPLRVGGFGSDHAGSVVNFVMGDGSVRPISDSINPALFRQKANRHDGNLTSSLD